ncbi:MAG: response regulator, partial [Verrucomicrobia bacterium]|nr:response regulator [Verrucomicrobiota bacterium]
MNNRVLCVDDEAGVLVFYQRVLRRQFAVDAVESGAEALELMAENGPYAAVVADLLMPAMDGLQLLAQVREK